MRPAADSIWTTKIQSQANAQRYRLRAHSLRPSRSEYFALTSFRGKKAVAGEIVDVTGDVNEGEEEAEKMLQLALGGDFVEDDIGDVGDVGENDAGAWTEVRRGFPVGEDREVPLFAL